MEENVKHLNAVGMDPALLKKQVSAYIKDGYVFLFEMRGWLYFGKYD